MFDRCELPDEQELDRRMRVVSGDGPLLDGIRTAVAARLAGRTIAGMGVANTVILAFAEQTAGYPAEVQQVVRVQARLMLEACLHSAPEPVQREALDHFAALGAA